MAFFTNDSIPLSDVFVANDNQREYQLMGNLTMEYILIFMIDFAELSEDSLLISTCCSCVITDKLTTSIDGLCLADIDVSKTNERRYVRN